MNSNQEKIYSCNNCNWSGSEKELDFDKVESCMGDDEVEVCPVCGSMNINVKIKKL